MILKASQKWGAFFLDFFNALYSAKSNLKI